MADQIVALALAVLAGFLAGFCSDYYQVIKNILKLKRAGLAAGDLIFWLLLTALVFALLSWGNKGEVRFYIFLGMGAGFLAYRYTLSTGVTRLIHLKLYLLNKLQQLVIKISRVSWLVFSFPFRLVYLGIALPAGFGADVLRRAGHKALEAGRRLAGRRVACRWRQFKIRLARLLKR